MTTIAVVVPTFNRFGLLKETVTSLQSQTHSASEFILVDDGSTSEIIDFLHSLPGADRRFRIIEKPSEHARGAQASRNVGLDAVRAEAVVFLDSDDILTESCLADRAAALREQPDFDIIVGSQAIRYPGNQQPCWVNIPDASKPDLDRFLAFSHAIDVPWVNGGVAVRTERLRKSAVRWRPEFHWDDVAFHFEILANGLRPYWLPRLSGPDSYYRMHTEERYGSKLSTDDGRKSTLSMVAWMMRILNDRRMLTSARRIKLEVSFFKTCILPAIDSGDFLLASNLLDEARAQGILSILKQAQVGTYTRGRSILRASARSTYFWNRMAEKVWMKRFFRRGRSTYGSVGTHLSLPS